MAFTFLSPHPVFLSLTGTTSSFSYKPVILPFSRNSRNLLVSAGPARRNSYPNPADDDPPEAPEDSMHGVSKFQQIQRQAARARKLEEEDFEKNRNTYLSAIADVEDATDTGRDDVESSGDLFSDIDRAISMKRSEFVKQGLLKPNPLFLNLLTKAKKIFDNNSQTHLLPFSAFINRGRKIRKSSTITFATDTVTYCTEVKSSVEDPMEVEVAEGYTMAQFCDKIIDLFLNEKPTVKQWKTYLVLRDEWNKYGEAQ